MTTAKLNVTLDRILALLLSCIPMCMGTLAFVNNMADWNGTIAHVVKPLVTLEALRDAPNFSWRALPASWAPILYLFVTTIELVVGLVALAAVITLLRRFRATTTAFVDACQIAERACTLGAITWLFFFFVMAGDWFMAWKSPGLVGVQRDSLMYAGASVFVLIALRATASRLLGADHPRTMAS